MSTKIAKLARKVKRIAGGEPHNRRQRSQLKRSLAALDHRARGVRQGHWRDIVAADRERLEKAVRIVVDDPRPMDFDDVVAALEANRNRQAGEP